MTAWLISYVYAQGVDTNPDTPDSVLAAVIALGTVMFTAAGWAIRTLWKSNQDHQTKYEVVQKEFNDQQQKQLERSLQVTIDATNRINVSEKTIEDAMKAVESATAMMHQLAGRQMAPELMTELLFRLRELKEMRGPAS